MTIVAHAHPFVIGVDTHARSHTIAILVAATGEPIATEQFPSAAPGMDRAISWAARRAGGDLAALWVIEGVATCGARLAAAVDHAGYEVVERHGWTLASTGVPASPTLLTPGVSPLRSCPWSPHPAAPPTQR